MSVGSMTSPRKGGGGGSLLFEGGEPFVTLSGPDSICVRAAFATPGYNQMQNWARSGNSASAVYGRTIK